MSASKRQADTETGVSSLAADIAVSEMMNLPLEDMCGWVLLAVRHTPDGGHSHEISHGPTGTDDWDWVAKVLELATEDLRSSL